jgi:hypothetical protein
MPILDAALAFALTMLVVGTVVTQIVSLIRNTPSCAASSYRRCLQNSGSRSFSR